MKVQFRKSFEKDLRKLRNTQLLERIKTIILEVEKANILEDIGNIKKLTARGSYYRIRVGAIHQKIGAIPSLHPLLHQTHPHVRLIASKPAFHSPCFQRRGLCSTNGPTSEFVYPSRSDSECGGKL